MYDLLKSVPNGFFTLVDTVFDHIKNQGLSVSFLTSFVDTLTKNCFKRPFTISKGTQYI